MFDRQRVLDLLNQYEADHAFAREIIPPVEDQLRWPALTLAALPNTYRWFRAPNVIDLEKIRRLRLAR
jgi:hypothetical protein